MCRYPLGSGGNRVCTRPPVQASLPVGINQLLNEVTTFFAFFIPLGGCVRLGCFHGTKLRWTFTS